MLALIESNKPTAGPSQGEPTRTRPLTLKPATPTTQSAYKKAPLQDDTKSLTELEKQAEQEVNFMSLKNRNKGEVLFSKFTRSECVHCSTLHVLVSYKTKVLCFVSVL